MSKLVYGALTDWTDVARGDSSRRHVLYRGFPGDKSDMICLQHAFSVFFFAWDIEDTFFPQAVSGTSGASGHHHYDHDNPVSIATPSSFSARTYPSPGSDDMGWADIVGLRRVEDTPWRFRGMFSLLPTDNSLIISITHKNIQHNTQKGRQRIRHRSWFPLAGLDGRRETKWTFHTIMFFSFFGAA